MSASASRLDRLEALDEALQRAVDAAWPLVRERAAGAHGADADADAARAAEAAGGHAGPSFEASASDVVAYAQHISYAAGAPPGYTPGLHAPWFSRPAPSDAEVRASTLFATGEEASPGVAAALAALQGEKPAGARKEGAKRKAEAGSVGGALDDEAALRKRKQPPGEADETHARPAHEVAGAAGVAAAGAADAPALAAPAKEAFFVDQVDLDLVSDDERVSVSDYSSSDFEDSD